MTSVWCVAFDVVLHAGVKSTYVHNAVQITTLVLISAATLHDLCAYMYVAGISPSVSPDTGALHSHSLNLTIEV